MQLHSARGVSEGRMGEQHQAEMFGIDPRPQLAAGYCRLIKSVMEARSVSVRALSSRLDI